MQRSHTQNKNTRTVCLDWPNHLVSLFYAIPHELQALFEGHIEARIECTERSKAVDLVHENERTTNAMRRSVFLGVSWVYVDEDNNE